MKSKHTSSIARPGKFIGSFAEVRAVPSDRIHIAFTGRSNSGKSSLLRAMLTNPSIVKVSRKPGSTQTINVFEWRTIYLVDLPGFGFASRSHELRDTFSDRIGGYLRGARAMRLLLCLLDCRRDPEEWELSLCAEFRESGLPVILVLTKSDKLNQKETSQVLKKIPQYISAGFSAVHLVSSHSGKGLAGLTEDPLFSELISTGSEEG